MYRRGTSTRQPADIARRRVGLAFGTIGLAVGSLAYATPAPAQPASAADGTWSDAKVIAQDPWISPYGDPAVKTNVASNGRVLTQWLQGADQLWGATRAPGGDWRAAQRISGAGQSVWNDAATAWGNGAITVAWRGTDANHVTGVWVRDLRADGTWGPVQRVARTGSSSVNRIDLEFDRNAAVTAAAWVRAGEVRVGWRPAGGGWQLSQPVPVTNASPLAVNVDANGRVDVLVWSHGKISSVRMHPNGTWQSPVQIAPRAGATWTGYSAVDSNGAGDLTIGWLERAGGQTKSVVATREVGQFWSIHELPDSAGGVDVAMSADGMVSAAWIAPTSATVRLQQRAADGTWGPIQELDSFPNEVSDSIGIDANARGDAIVRYLAQPCASGDPCRTWTVVRCISGDGCSAPMELAPPVWWFYPEVRLGPQGEAYAQWGAGCHTEACYYTAVRSRILPPPI
jgi:hypothetical protein